MGEPLVGSTKSGYDYARRMTNENQMVATMCPGLGIATITPEALASAIPSDPMIDGHSDKHRNHIGRVKFIFDSPSDDEMQSILLMNGNQHGAPDLDEPHFADGRHRFLAAVLPGDTTIYAEMRWASGTLVDFLSRPVIAYLTGLSDVKPRGTAAEWRESPEWKIWEESDEYVEFF